MDQRCEAVEPNRITAHRLSTAVFEVKQQETAKNSSQNSRIFSGSSKVVRYECRCYSRNNGDEFEVIIEGMLPGRSFR